MVRWQRDPRARKRAAMMVCAAEIVLVPLVAYVPGLFYVYRVLMRLGFGQEGASSSVSWVTAIPCAVLGAWLIVQSVFYLKGRRWTRVAFIAVNALVILAGIVWVLMAPKDPGALGYGLLVPMVTLFPMIGVFVGLNPMPEPRAR